MLADMHPATSPGFMTTPQSDARVDGRSVNPAAWLRDRGEPHIVWDALDSYLGNSALNSPHSIPSTEPPMPDQPSSRRDALSAEQIAFLIESGTVTAERFAEVSARVARGDLEARERKSRQDAIDAALRSNEVAERLGIDVAEVHRRRSEGQLYAFIAGREELYPGWQFTDDAERPILPGLARLVASFPIGMHAATIRGFMNTPQRSARIDDVPVTPVQWLTRSGDPQVLKDILEGFLLT